MLRKPLHRTICWRLRKQPCNFFSISLIVMADEFRIKFDVCWAKIFSNPRKNSVTLESSGSMTLKNVKCMVRLMDMNCLNIKETNASTRSEERRVGKEC